MTRIDFTEDVTGAATKTGELPSAVVQEAARMAEQRDVQAARDEQRPHPERVARRGRARLSGEDRAALWRERGYAMRYQLRRWPRYYWRHLGFAWAGLVIMAKAMVTFRRWDEQADAVHIKKRQAAAVNATDQMIAEFDRERIKLRNRRRVAEVLDVALVVGPVGYFVWLWRTVDPAALSAYQLFGWWVDARWLAMVASALVAATLLGFVGRRGFAVKDPTPWQASTTGMTPSGAIIYALTHIGYGAINTAVKELPNRLLLPHHVFVSADDEVRPTIDGGYRCRITLPGGANVEGVRARVQAFSSAVGIGTERLDIEQGEHAGIMVLTIAGDQQRPAEVDPLADGEPVNLFDGFPIGTKANGQPALIDLMFAGLAAFGKSGYGKSSLMRRICSWVVRHPGAELDIVHCKPAADYAEFEDVATTHLNGMPNTVEFRTQVMHALQAIVDDLDRRGEALARAVGLYPKMRNHEVDGVVCNDPDLGLHPRIVVLDEPDGLFKPGDQIAQATAELCVLIASKGRAFGVRLVMAGHDAEEPATPSALLGNLPQRLAFKMANANQTRMVLGEHATRLGWNADQLNSIGQAYIVALTPDGAEVTGRLGTHEHTAADAAEFGEVSRRLRAEFGVPVRQRWTAPDIDEAEAAGPGAPAAGDLAVTMLDMVLQVWPSEPSGGPVEKLALADVAFLLDRDGLVPGATGPAVSAALAGPVAGLIGSSRADGRRIQAVGRRGLSGAGKGTALLHSETVSTHARLTVSEGGNDAG